MTLDLNSLPQLLVAGIATLMGKYAWDRWLSQNSRVTQKECTQHRENCHREIMEKIRAQEVHLVEGDGCFEQFSKTLMVVCLTQLKMCEALHIDCDEIKRVMVNKGILD